RRSGLQGGAARLQGRAHGPHRAPLRQVLAARRLPVREADPPDVHRQVPQDEAAGRLRRSPREAARLSALPITTPGGVWGAPRGSPWGPVSPLCAPRAPGGPEPDGGGQPPQRGLVPCAVDTAGAAGAAALLQPAAARAAAAVAVSAAAPGATAGAAATGPE